VLKADRILAREAIYSGDEIRDAEAGMAFGAVAWGHHFLERSTIKIPNSISPTQARLEKR